MMFVVFMLLGCMSIHAADDGLITEQITIKLDKAGTLPDKIADEDKYKITNLKIAGKINGTDLRLIRDIAGRDFLGEKTPGRLSVLDLSEARIIYGGKAYYFEYFSYDTSDDVLGRYAFKNCNRLTEVVLPAGLKKIGGEVFMNCSNLKSIILPSTLTSIGASAFDGCSSLSNIELPSSLKDIDQCAFEGCSNLNSITLPEGITSVKFRTFSGCQSLTSITFPSTLKRIGECAFDGCRKLAEITFPSSLKSFGYQAF